MALDEICYLYACDGSGPRYYLNGTSGYTLNGQFAFYLADDRNVYWADGRPAFYLDGHHFCNEAGAVLYRTDEMKQKIDEPEAEADAE
jgi:hypothetical protein